MVLPLRDEGAISLGIGNIPGLFAGSLLLTLIAAPISTLLFSLPNLPKPKALVLIYRFFSASLVLFFILWVLSSPENTFPSFKGFLNMSSTIKEDLKVETQPVSTNATNWDKHGWFYITVRIGFFLWVALLNLITVSSTWARVADVMDNEVQDCLDLLVRVLLSVSFLVHCLPQDWPGWDHIYCCLLHS